MSVLSRICDSVRARVAERKKQLSATQARERASSAREPGDFVSALRVGQGPAVIAEVKFASPSEGRIWQGQPSALEAARVASEYLSSGARALSVLTEQDHFGGSHSYLSAIRASHPDSALLMKDFVLEEFQLHEARIHGADAVLLMLSVLEDESAARLLECAEQLGLHALVEVHDVDELSRAARLGAKLIGINNRDLKTLEVSLSVSERLAPLAPRGATLVSESGIGAASDLSRLSQKGFSAFLVGTNLMRGGEPGKALRLLTGRAP